MSDLNADLELALRAADAGAAVLRAHDGTRGSLAVREKSRADLVTEVDEAAERAVLAVLEAGRPDDGVLAEESGGSGHAGGRCWVIDPIDGTTNLVHQHPFCCVSVALVDEQGVAVGVVDAPRLGEVYHAMRGGGTHLNGEPVETSRIERWDRALVGTGFPFRSGKGRAGPYMSLVGAVVESTHGVRRAGSAALDLAYVACGRLDAFFEVGLAPWDVGAGILLVREAGGRVTGWPADTEPPEDSGRILASNGPLHGALTDAVAPFRAAIA